MAEKKKTSSTGRSKNSRSKKAAELEAQRIREEALKRSLTRRRIGSVILAAVGVVVALMAIVPGGEGEGWRYIHTAVLGLFGIGAYIIGPLMVYAAVIIGAKKPKNAVIFTIVKITLFLLMVCAAQEIFCGGSYNSDENKNIFVNLYNGGSSFKGGGVFSIILGVPLLQLGQFGAAVIIIIIALVCVFLMTNLTLGELGALIGRLFRNAGEKAKENRRRRAEESEMVREEYERLDREEKENRQSAAAQRRIRAELDAEYRKKSKLNGLKNVVENVDEAEELPEAAPEVPAAERPREPKTPLPKIPEAVDNKEILQEQDEDDRDYRDALRRYMEKRHPIMKEDTLEDPNAEIAPIIDALNKFNEEHPKTARVSRIIDAPREQITTSDEPLRETEETDISDYEEAELPFDLEDIITESRLQSEAPAPQTAKPVQIAPAPPSFKPANESGNRQIQLSDVYTLPPISLLNPVQNRTPQADIEAELQNNAKKLVETLKSFGVSTTYTGASRGPSVTRYELQPAPGVKIGKITNLADDIALNLASSGVRIAPVPNKAAVGVEIPNDHRDTVYFRELVESPDFKQSFDKKLVSVLGKDISGSTVTCNVSKMPHLLIAGTTGSGKSVCVNSIIMSILMKSTPRDVRLIMVDPKQVEFMMYNGIPHLLIPVVTDPKKAAGALAWSVTEMENRYTMFSENNVRNIDGYNELAEQSDGELPHMPHIVIFIDELADLMMASPKDVEDSIVRLAQKARAAGMHLVIATQKPTVQVVTGLIKGNIPSRIALMVASQIDSRVILDASGAEKLLGNGDMLYMPVGVPKPIRLQGCYVSDNEVERVVEFIKQTFSAEYDESIIAEIERQTEIVSSGDKGASAEETEGDEVDDKLEDAIEYVVTAGQASTSALQRNLKLGYGRAARLIDTMEKMGIVGAYEGAKPRQVLMTRQEWYERKMNK